MLLALLRGRLGRKPAHDPAPPPAPDSLFRSTAPGAARPAALPAVATLQPVTESYARMRLTCAKTQQALAAGEIKSWEEFGASLAGAGIDHLIITGENKKGLPVWTSWLRDRRTGEIVACVSVYKSFTMRDLTKLLGPHPKWAPSPSADNAPAADRAPAAPRFVVTADDQVMVSQGAMRVPAGIGVADLPPGSYAWELEDRSYGSILVHADGSRIHYDSKRQPLKLTPARTARPRLVDTAANAE